MTPDGSSRLIIAHPNRPPYDADFSRALDARLRGIAAQQNETSQPPLSVEFAGGHRIAVETEAFIRRESIMNTVGALALILPLLYLLFRALGWWRWISTFSPFVIVVLRPLWFRRVTLSAAAPFAACSSGWCRCVVLLYVSHRPRSRRRCLRTRRWKLQSNHRKACCADVDDCCDFYA